jgi:hypothetical protein
MVALFPGRKCCRPIPFAKAPMRRIRPLSKIASIGKYCGRLRKVCQRFGEKNAIWKRGFRGAGRSFTRELVFPDSVRPTSIKFGMWEPGFGAPQDHRITHTRRERRENGEEKREKRIVTNAI